MLRLMDDFTHIGFACDSLNFQYSKVKLVRPYRIEPEKICGFKPVQGE
jgi:hypothetical protein